MYVCIYIYAWRHFEPSLVGRCLHFLFHTKSFNFNTQRVSFKRAEV